MLLESRIDENTVLYIDTESKGGFSKDTLSGNWNPDEALDNVVRIAAIVGKRLAEAATVAATQEPAPESLNLDFSVKVDGNSVVCVGRTPEDGQFRITARWASRRPGG